MNDKKTAPYGSWKSPITSEMIASGTVGLAALGYDGDDVYWIESRPAENGRHVVVRRTPDGKTEDVTPSPFYARSRVHEYGGGAVVVHSGTVYFSNFTDQRIYYHKPGEELRPLTPDTGAKMFYADGVIDEKRNRLVCIREDHTQGDREAQNTVVAIDLDKGGEGDILVSGADFYSNPRVSPDGTFLCWLQWNHPNMPWDGTELWVARVGDDGSLSNREKIEGSERVSVFQPQWSPTGVLHFVSDRTNWWNIYRSRGGAIEPIAPMEAEFAEAQWTFGVSTYAFTAPQRIICRYVQNGVWNLAWIDTASGVLQDINSPYTGIDDICAKPGRAVFVASSPNQPAAIVEFDFEANAFHVLARSTEAGIDPEYLAEPEAIEFATENGKTAHAFYYEPQNREFEGPRDERPPLLVIGHGGPTGATCGTLKWKIQYWASRGIAVADVNYGGSTGYGRPYRDRLIEQWGIVDRDDATNAARYLVDRERVDGERIAIRGGSAGGYLTLCCLTFKDVFKVGASYYGVSDLEVLTKETHKFESHYLDKMVGPYPETKGRYEARSPLHFTDRLSCPIIFFQGDEDKICPPNQTEMMGDALRKKGLPVAVLMFEGEQHGFRKAENIKRSLEAELYFYSKILGFEPADEIEPVEIENLEE
jgi:dipeptidyl aminopeptidase/acylaminoacyl peptidase